MLKEEIRKLKKGYWGNLTTSSFLEKDGKRLFCLGGIFSKRFYVIDSDETEIRLRKKLIQQYQIMLGLSLLPVLFSKSSVMVQWPVLIGILLFLFLVQRICLKVLLGKELDRLQILEGRISIKEQYGYLSRESSNTKLWFGFLGSVAFVILSIVLMKINPQAMPVALCSIVFFGICALAWGYALFIKKN